MPVYSTTGGAVQNAIVQYASYDISEVTSFTLVWPSSYQDSENVVAGWMRFTGGIGSGSHVILIFPDATQVSQGMNFIIQNTSAFALEVQESTGTTLVEIDSGQMFYFILSDNSTQGGSWENVVLGAGTSNVQPTELAGYGLNASAFLAQTPPTLNTEIALNVLDRGTTNYEVEISDYTTMIVYTGNSGTITLPDISTVLPLLPNTVPGSFYVSINNVGPGTVSVVSDVGDGIQGLLTFNLENNQTVTLVAIPIAFTIGGVATKWFTLGYGQAAALGINLNQMNVTGGTLNLTNAQANATLQVYSGTLASNQVMIFPTQPGFWVFSNEATLNGFTLSVRLGSTTPIVLPANESVMAYSDNTGMYFVPSTTPGVSSVQLSSNTGLFTNPSTAQTGAVQIFVDLPVSPTTNTFLSATGVSPQVVTWLSAQTTINNILGISHTRGAIVVFSGTNWSVLPPGTNGQVLTMVSGTPAWV